MPHQQVLSSLEDRSPKLWVCSKHAHIDGSCNSSATGLHLSLTFAAYWKLKFEWQYTAETRFHHHRGRKRADIVEVHPTAAGSPRGNIEGLKQVYHGTIYQCILIAWVLTWFGGFFSKKNVNDSMEVVMTEIQLASVPILCNDKKTDRCCSPGSAFKSHVLHHVVDDSTNTLGSKKQRANQILWTNHTGYLLQLVNKKDSFRNNLVSIKQPESIQETRFP